MTPTEEQTAEERMSNFETEYFGELRRLKECARQRGDHTAFCSAADDIAKLRLTNQRLEVENSTLRARTEDMKELEQGLMMKETRIKELEAEVERMKDLRRLAMELVELDDSRQSGRPCTGWEAEHLLIVESMRARLRELESQKGKER